VFRKFWLAVMIVPSSLNSMTAWERSMAADCASARAVSALLCRLTSGCLSENKPQRGWAWDAECERYREQPLQMIEKLG